MDELFVPPAAQVQSRPLFVFLKAFFRVRGVRQSLLGNRWPPSCALLSVFRVMLRAESSPAIYPR